MGIVHGLEGNAGVIAVEVAILDQVFDGINDLEHLSVWRLMHTYIVDVPS